MGRVNKTLNEKIPKKNKLPNFFPVDFMGGDAKSPQHTSVHPMYVSYSSIPTSASTTMTSNKLINNNQNGLSSNTNTLQSQIIFNNNRNSNISYDNRSEVRYTSVVSTERLVNNHDDDQNVVENYSLNSFGTVNRLHDSVGYLPKKRPNYLQETNNFDNPTTSTSQSQQSSQRVGDIHHQMLDYSMRRANYNVPNHPNHSIASTSSSKQFTNQLGYDNNTNDVVVDNYKMPIQYLTRSPNLNRVNSRRRNERPNIVNNFDQIRDTPPGYNNDNNNILMQRAKSQDRLSYRKRSGNRQTLTNNSQTSRGSNNNIDRKSQRPRSYCSNGSYHE